MGMHARFKKLNLIECAIPKTLWIGDTLILECLLPELSRPDLELSTCVYAYAYMLMYMLIYNELCSPISKTINMYPSRAAGSVQQPF